MAGVVTALRLQSRRTDRVNVFIDGEFALGLAKILAAGLRVGQRLSDEEIADLQRKDTEEEMVRWAVRALSRRPRTEWELRTGMKRKNIPSAIQEAVIGRLQNAGLIDDEAFAKAWTENRLTFRPRSARALRAELRRKGVSSEEIDGVLEEFDETEAAWKAARKGSHRYQGLSERDFRRRLSAYLSRRGFDYPTIAPVVEQLVREITFPGEESEV